MAEFEKSMMADINVKFDEQQTQLSEELKSLNEQLKNTKDLLPQDEEMAKLASDYVRFRVALLIPKFSIGLENEFG